VYSGEFMSGGIIGDLTDARNLGYCIKWPNTPELLAVLKGQLLECFNPLYWDSSSGSLDDVLALLYDTLENNLMPSYCAIPGEVRAYAGSPSDVSDYFGWLLCSGQCLLQAEHPELFAAIGTTYGDGGNPSTQFQVPGLNGRVVVGWAGGTGQFSAVGNTGGSETVTLGTSQMPSHSHAFGLPTGVYASGVSYRQTQGVGGSGLGASSGNLHQTLSPLIGNSGGGNAHENTQPYIVLTYMIYSGRPPGTGCQ